MAARLSYACLEGLERRNEIKVGRLSEMGCVHLRVLYYQAFAFQRSKVKELYEMHTKTLIVPFAGNSSIIILSSNALPYAYLPSAVFPINDDKMFIMRAYSFHKGRRPTSDSWGCECRWTTGVAYSPVACVLFHPF
ncbi:hypothetical protein EVAR_10558_1 [Eumeta japonica]|uniref:Uncharacterized protein n=1 Tax=Eumeta variegata TaxID=151549 RepID=A0A4C1ZNA0_EUMVA|nr:hypothetical protein EVAR_10558_1 [Eumeta japonica]